MTPREQIRMLKTLIKELAADQIPAKRLRKTKLPPEELALLEKKMEGRTLAGFSRPYDVWLRGCRITAALNLYLELRGREYRHGMNEHTKWAVESERKKLLEKLEAEPAKA